MACRPSFSTWPTREATSSPRRPRSSDAASRRVKGRQAAGRLRAHTAHQVGKPDLRAQLDAFHPIDEQSPLFGQDEDTLAASENNFVVSIVGFDEASGQMVRARD